MSGCSIKLEHGKTYVSRSGRVYGPLIDTKDGSNFPFEVSNGESKCWKENGSYLLYLGSSFDLVREYVEPAPQVEKANDPVNNPSHYASGAVECIDAIQASMSVEAFRGYCKGNVQKYVWRYETKDEAESLRKAEWYLKRLLATFV